jgi:threonylcarbamoyladenosine tRNA methylthiotransferase CDKAL1
MNLMQIYVRTFGCTANTADSEAIAGCLKTAGYTLTQTEAKADIVIYNTCAVKGPTENRIINALKHVPKSQKIIIVGCLPQVSFERLMRETRFDAALGPAVGEGIVKVVRRVANGETVIDLQSTKAAKPKLDLPRIQANPLVSVVPVSFGCLGSCTYCCVVHARGQLRSCTIAEVANRIKADVALGAREFWLTSQDMGCYGLDIGTNLAKLLKAVTAVDGDFWVRVGMMTPSFVMPFLDDLVAAFGSEKIFKFAHLPVQSGDDQILERMRRFYTVAEFKETVAAFRKVCPEITLSTDVIAGFPGETQKAFENTLQLVRDVQPDIVNVSKFFARPKTAASEMQSEAVDKKEIKRRSTQAAALAKQVSLAKSQRWLGWTGEIFVDEPGKVGGTWVGRNFAYKPIAVKSKKKLLGQTIQVSVTAASETHLSGAVEKVSMVR